MKIVATTNALVAGLQSAGRATLKRDTVLAGVLLTAGPDGLKVTGTDRDITIMAKVPTQQLDGEGSVLVNAQVLSGLAAAASGSEVTLVTEGDELTASSGRAVWTLRTIDPKSFPTIEHLIGGKPVDAKAFLTAVRRVLPAVSDDGARPVLQGLRFEQEGPDTPLSLVGTDSYRLTKVDLPFGVNIAGPLTVPGRALAELARVKTSEVDIASSTHLVTFSTPDIQVTSRRIEGEYPPYKGVIGNPKADGRASLIISREDLSEAIKRVSVLASDQHHVVVLEVSESGVILRARSTEEGTAKEALDAEYSGDDYQLGFNGRYLTEGLEAAGGDMVKFSIISAKKQVYLTAEGDEGFLHLLMPVAG